MKKLSLRSYFEIVMVAIIALLLAVIAIERGKANKRQQDLNNRLSDALGSIEIYEGVQYRLAEESRIKERKIEELLGENTRLDDTIRKLDGEVYNLTQINASLREELEFSSQDEGSSATTTIVRYVCPETTDGGEEVPTEIPNLRVDFDLLSGGFRAIGFTETNPSHAELRLLQEEPFVVDIALIQSDNGEWSSIASEQTDRLELEIGELIVDERVVNERWYERLGVGLSVHAGEGTFGAGPALHLETGALDFGLSATYDIARNSIVGGFSATYRPFRRR